MKKPMKDPLLEKLATRIADGMYMDSDFLRENNVSADDCYGLYTRLAAVVRGYLKAPARVQYALLASSADDEGRLTESLWLIAAETMLNERTDELLAKLK